MSRLFIWPALLLVVGGLLGVCLGGRPDALEVPIEEHHALLISRITEVAELVTLKVPVSTVITSELAGYLGGVRCVVVVNGDVELGVDLEAARLEDVDPKARTATLILPDPKVRHARLDHERTTVYSLDRQGLWWLVFSNEPARRLVNRAMKQAQAEVESAAQDPGLVEQARRRAEWVLRGAFEVIGWEIDLAWSSYRAARASLNKHDSECVRSHGYVARITPQALPSFLVPQSVTFMPMACAMAALVSIAWSADFASLA